MSASVIGLDLSITATGIADVFGNTVTTGGKAELGDDRLLVIATVIRSYILDGCDLAVIEDIPTHAHGAGITAMVHGAVRPLLRKWHTPYVLVPPASLKKYATGKGNAGKPDMAVALYKRTGLELADDNQVDAAWLRFMGLDALGCPEFELPAVQRAALDKIDWPVTA